MDFNLNDTEHCKCCDRALNPKRIVWLEKSLRGGRYTDKPGVISAADSQGWFPFGPGCAKKILAKQVAA